MGFSLAGNFFSAWTLADCRFLYADPTDFPSPPQPDAASGAATASTTTTTSRYTGYVGLYTIEEEIVESIDGSVARIYARCASIPGDAVDEFDTKYKVGRLLGVAGLTTGGLGTIVLILTFFMEMCCATPGVQYALGVIYTIAAAAQGLTFLGVDTPKCERMGCVISTTATWSILAVCLYFIALVHAFVVPFPETRICPCCTKDAEGDEEKEEVDYFVEEEDVEAQNGSSADDDEEDDAASGEGGAAAAAAAGIGGAAAGATGDAATAAVAGAAVAGAAVAGAAVAGAAVAAGDGNDGDGSNIGDGETGVVEPSASSDAATSSEYCATSIYASVKDAVSSLVAPAEEKSVAEEIVSESLHSTSAGVEIAAGAATEPADAATADKTE